MVFSEKQKIQEEQYAVPYHWFMERDAFDGRAYFGYLDFCVDVLRGAKNDVKILDAGCGEGRFLGEVGKLGFRNLYGMDYSERAIAFAKTLVPEAVFSRADLTEKLSFEDNFFDYIFLIEVLEHIAPDSIDCLLSELKRILKDGGELVITTPSFNLPLSAKSHKHYQHFSVSSLRAYTEPHFQEIAVVGQDRVRAFDAVYKLLENRYWDIKILRKFWNNRLWLKFFNTCRPSKGRRLIARLRKTTPKPAVKPV